MGNIALINEKRKWLFKIILVLSVAFVGKLSSNNFINNDNYFPIAYLFMLEYPEFFNSLTSFIPLQISKGVLYFFLNIFITPLSSTYAPLPYVIYPVLKQFDDIENILSATLIVNLIINSFILIKAFNLFNNQKLSNVFIASYLLSVFGIGHLIYAGSNMPYAYTLSSTLLIIGLAIDDKNSIAKDIWIILSLFLLNYQVIYLMPAYFVVKAREVRVSKLKIRKKEIFAFFSLITIVLSAVLFISLRGRLTGTHSNVGVNWNSGINNEYKFDYNENFLSEVIDLIITLPKSIIYHINEDLFDIKLLAIGVLLILVCFGISDQYRKNHNSRMNVFFYASIVSFIILVFMEKAVYGPTRHTLYLLPLFTVYIFDNLYKLNIKNLHVLWILLLFPILSKNLPTMISRKNNFTEKLKELGAYVERYQNHDLLLVNCSYQPFLEDSFRTSIKNRKVYFFCGSRLQKINSGLPNKDSILIIDATAKNILRLKTEINERLQREKYNTTELRLIDQLMKLEYNMEQKDITQNPQKTGIIIWEAENKLQI